MSNLGKEMARRIRKWEDGQAKTYAVAAVLAAVEASPSPAKSAASTGRARASVSAASGDPAEYVPPLSRSYRQPTKTDALRGVRGRAPGQSVFVDIGVPYRDYVAEKYRPIQAGHAAGEAAIALDDGRALSG